MENNKIIEEHLSSLLLKGYTAKELDTLNSKLNSLDELKGKIDFEQLDMFKVAIILSFDLLGQEMKISLFSLPKDKLEIYLENIPEKFERILNINFNKGEFDLLKNKLIESL